MNRSFIAMAMLAMTGGAHAEEGVSFSREIAPVFRTQCATCHMTGEEPGGMKLYPSAAYASIVNVPSQQSPIARVTPGKPQESYLLHKLEETHLEVGGSGVRMPFAQPPLSEDTRQRIRLWIEQGALNN
jgi:mono/diheme cytochrome c family protein